MSGAKGITAPTTTFIGCRMVEGIALSIMDSQGVSQSITLNGMAQARNYIPSVGIMPGMVGVTEVSVDFWTAWKKQSTMSSFLSNSLLLEGTSADDVERQARALAGIKDLTPAAST